MNYPDYGAASIVTNGRTKHVTYRQITPEDYDAECVTVAERLGLTYGGSR